MPSNRRGYNLERRVKKMLEDMGAYAIKSSASRGVFDVIAIFPHERPIGVQCKHSGYLRPAERQEIMKTAEKYNIIPAIAYVSKNRTHIELLCRGKTLEDIAKENPLSPKD